MNEDYAADIIFAAVIGGIIGAKLWYVLFSGEWDSLFRRGGFVWYGGFLGGVVAVLLNGWRKGVPARWTCELTATAVPLGHALGRVGCFLVNDDYGIPSTLPWAMKFPEGLPPTTVANLEQMHVTFPPGTNPAEVVAVHPTQLYETALLLLRSEEHTSELQSQSNLVCRLLLEKKKKRSPRPQRIKVKLADGKERTIQHMLVTSFWHPDGTPMSAQQFMEMLFGRLPEFFKTEAELRTLWSEPDTRKKLLQGLAEKGFGGEQLAAMQRIIDAEKSDLFDVLAHVAYALPPVSREERAARAKVVISTQFNNKQRIFLDF